MTQLDLDQIEASAAHLYEYGTLDDAPLQADLDQLTGTAVPAMAAEIRRLSAERDSLQAHFDQAIKGFNASALEITQLRAELATAREQAITDVGDWLDEIGEKDAAYLVRTVDIPATEETHVVADDSSDPEPSTRPCGHGKSA